MSDLREISPTSTNPFPRSESVFSTSSVRSFSQTLLESVREEDTIAQAVEGYDHLGFQDASSHPFLRWADHSHVSTPEAFQSSIRHSDIVTFSFRVLWLPDNEESFPSLLFSPQNEVNSLLRVIPVLKKAHQHRQTLLLSIDQISEIERYWTGENTQPSSGLTITKPTQIVSAFLFFRTYCRPEDWQVIREVYCIIWSSQAAKFLKGRLNTNLDPRFESGRVQHSDIIGAFQQLRNLSGRHSVAYALQNISLILSPRSDISSTGRRLEWRQPQDQGVSEPVIAQYFALFNSISKSGDRVRSSHHHSHRLLRVTRTEQASDTPADLPHVPENVGQGGAMLALKPSLWPSQCPRFCLFILLDQDFDDKARLAGLLRYTIESREMYGELEKTAQGQLSLSASDIHILGSWLDSFGPG